jgi:hypothetical protein
MPLRDYKTSPRKHTAHGRHDWHVQELWLVALLVVVIGLGVTLYVLNTKTFVATEPVTLCPVKVPPSEVNVLLLDSSDPLSQQQRLQIRNEISRLRNSVGRWGAIEVFAVDSNLENVTKPLIRLCNPGTGDELNRLYQNPDLARRRWETFVATLDSAIDRQTVAASLGVSPIFEAIQATSLRVFGRTEHDGLRKRLVVVSDLLQHVPGRLSMYEAIPEYTDFRSSPYSTSVRADLAGVSVVILYLARNETTQQGRRHVEFWDAYFTNQGATVERVQKIFGDR